MHHDLINTKTNQPICNVTQIRVRYSKKPFNNDSSGHKNYLPEEDWEDIGQGPPIGNVILQDTPLLVNVKGILICNSDETMLKAFFLTGYKVTIEFNSVFKFNRMWLST